MRRLRLLLGTVLCATAALWGCGGDEGSGGKAPSEVVPGDAVVYLEAEIDPSGDQEEAVHSIVEKFPGEGEPDDRLAGLVDQVLRETDAPLDYSEDVEPWIGDRVGLFLKSLTSPEGAAVIATEDSDKARDSLEKLVKGDEREHEGVDVRVDDETAGAIVDGFLVVGSEGGVEAAIDASKGNSLDEAELYGNATEDLPEERLATFFVDGAKIAQVQGPSSGLFGLAQEPFAGSIDAEGNAILAESVLSGEAAAFSSGFFPAATPLVGELPGDSWYAAGQPKFGEAFAAALGAGGAITGGGGPLVEQFERQTGLDIQRDLASWMGDLGIFARGTTQDDLDVAVLLRVTDRAAARRGIGRVEDAIRRLGEGATVRPLGAPGGGEGFTLNTDLPKPIHAVLRGDRFVLAYGDDAVRQAFDPPTRLADQAAVREAMGRLGEGYELATFLDAAPLLALIEDFGVGTDPGYQKAKPYLTPFARLVAGARREGDELRSKLRIELR